MSGWFMMAFRSPCIISTGVGILIWTLPSLPITGSSRVFLTNTVGGKKSRKV